MRSLEAQVARFEAENAQLRASLSESQTKSVLLEEKLRAAVAELDSLKNAPSPPPTSPTTYQAREGDAVARVARGFVSGGSRRAGLTTIPRTSRLSSSRWGFKR